MNKKTMTKMMLQPLIGFFMICSLFYLNKEITYFSGVGQVTADTTSPTTNAAITITPADFLNYFKLNGSASYDGSILTLTPASASKIGSATMKQNIEGQQDWVLTGELNIGIPHSSGNKNGADGVGFGWLPDNLGTVGQAGNQMGIGGLKGAFGWVADTYENDFDTKEVFTWRDVGKKGTNPTQTINGTPGYLYSGDPNYSGSKDPLIKNTWAMGGFGYANPNRNNMYTSYNPTKSSASVQSIISLEDGQFHPFLMTYQASSRLVTVTFGSLTWSVPFDNLLSASGDLATDAISFFITGSTGDQYNLQQLKFNSMSFTPAPAKNSVTVNYIDTKGRPVAVPQYLTQPAWVIFPPSYATSPLGQTPANMHFNSVSSSDPNTSFDPVTHKGSGKYTASGTVINYVYAPNKATINYVDDYAGTTVSQDNIDYFSNPSYTTASKLSDYKAKGYSLVTDNVPPSNLFGQDGMTYTVHLQHTYATTLTTVKETIRYVDNSTKGLVSQISPNPYVATKTFLTTTDNVTGKQSYYYQNGTKTTTPSLTAAGVVTDTAWVKVDQVNGTWVDASANQIKFDQVNNPIAKNYMIVDTTDPNKTSATQKASVTAQVISTTLKDSAIDVYYNPTKVVPTTYTMTQSINYLDGNDHKLVVAQQAHQTAKFTAYQVIDSVTNAILGYDTNNDGMADSTQVVWIADTQNGTTNHTISSPSLVSKGYGQASQQSISSFSSVPTITDNSKITGQAITDSLPDVNVYYNLSGSNIKLPKTGGSGLVYVIVIAITSATVATVLYRKKYRD